MKFPSSLCVLAALPLLSIAQTIDASTALSTTVTASSVPATPPANTSSPATPPPASSGPSTPVPVTPSTTPSTPVPTSTPVLTTLTYDPIYDNAGQSLNAVACSNGPNGLITRGFTTFGSFSKFPNIGGGFPVTGWNSPSCGTCWELSYTDPAKVTKTIDVLVIDVAVNSFNIGLTAMNNLTSGNAVQFGRVSIAASPVAASRCGL